MTNLAGFGVGLLASGSTLPYDWVAAKSGRDEQGMAGVELGF